MNIIPKQIKNSLRFHSIATVTFIIIGCNSNKYIKEIPYKFSYDDDKIKKDLNIDDSGSSEVVSRDSLTTDQLELQEYFASYLEVPPEEITNFKLYGTIKQWMGTPYSKDGNSKDGMSAAAFAQFLYQDAYGASIPNIPLAIFNAPNVFQFSGREYLKEGDFIFFRDKKTTAVTDVAIYLKNDRILTSVPEGGLSIYKFHSGNFQERFICGGRLNKDN